MKRNLIVLLNWHGRIQIVKSFFTDVTSPGENKEINVIQVGNRKHIFLRIKSSMKLKGVLETIVTIKC